MVKIRNLLGYYITSENDPLFFKAIYEVTEHDFWNELTEVQKEVITFFDTLQNPKNLKG